MTQYEVVSRDTDAPLSGFDRVIEYLLVALLAFMPFAFGVVHAWSEEVVFALSGAIVICFFLKLICHNGQRIIRTWAYLPLAFFVLIVVLQLIPLPASVVNLLSANTAVVKTELLADLPHADKLLNPMPLTFYPNATKHDLRLVIAAAAVFVVVLNVFRRPRQIKRLLMAIAIIGGITALLALAQNLFGNGKIYWLVASENTRGHSGPFVCHSHYGQFMNLSIGAAIGLLIVKLQQLFADRNITAPLLFERLGSRPARTIWLLAAVISIGAATVFISLSRGAVISMLVALTLTMLILIRRKSLRKHAWIMLVVALAALTCVLYVGFDGVYNRLASLRNLNAYQDRWQILKDVTTSFRQFPLLGTGLGTHSVVYPMFSNLKTAALITHAENEYAQAAEETGLIGLALLVAFGIMICVAYVRNIRNSRRPVRFAAYGLGFGIVAILVHSITDFGQHLPANGFLSAVFCALLLVLAHNPARQMRFVQVATPSGKAGTLRTFVLLAISAAWLWGLVGADQCRRTEAHWKKALGMETELRNRNWQGTDAEYARLISHAQAAVRCQPENAEYRHWLNVYRLHSISRQTHPDTLEVPEYAMAAVRGIVDDLHKVRTFCPTYGPAYTILGQIEKFVLENDAGAEHIRKGFLLAPCDPTVCFMAGYLDVLEGKFDDSIEKFDKAVEIDAAMFEDVVKLFIDYLSRPDLAILAAGDDIGRLSYLLYALEDMQYTDLAQQTREKLKNLLEARCSQSDAPAKFFASLGNIYRKQQNNEMAIKYYRRALTLDYSQVGWRISLAALLADTGSVTEAIRQTRICLRLRPQFKRAKNLLAVLSLRPTPLDEKIESP